MRKAILSLTDLTPSKRMTLTLLAASLVGMVVLFGVGLRTAQTQTGDENSHAFLYDSTNGMKDLGTLGGTNSYAYGINDSGQVVGYSDTANSGPHAFLYDSTNGMKDLGTLGGTNSY